VSLVLVTATGCRPVAWALCERWMLAQDYAGQVRWVIVDDGEVPQPITFERAGWELQVIRPEPYWKPGRNTQARNLSAGLRVAGDARVVIIEDDDYYAPGWLSSVDRLFHGAEIVGEAPATYYNVQERRGRVLRNSQHASLCATAVRGGALRYLAKLCRTPRKFIDLDLWRAWRSRGLLVKSRQVVGIKGLPGRAGIGMGHDKQFTATSDPDGEMLRAFVGDDAARLILGAA
jgi:hypothetical protein